MKPWKICLAAGLFSLATAAQAAQDSGTDAPQVVRGAFGSLILSTSSCQETLETAEALRTWLLSVELDSASSCTIEESRLIRDTNGSCSYDVTQCVPELARQVHDTFPVHSGPNCFNLALHTVGLNDGLRFASEEEMTMYMSSPVCKKLDASETPQPGDIGAIRTHPVNGVYEIHGFVYITENLVFSKNTIDKTSSYSLQPAEDVFHYYPVGPSRKCKGAYPYFLENCPNKVDYFRCGSLEDYWKMQPELAAIARPMLDTFATFEKRVEQLAVDGETVRVPDREFLLGLPAQIEAFHAGRFQLRIEDQAYHELFVMRILATRITSVMAQLNMVVPYTKKDPMIEELKMLLTEARAKLFREN